MPKSGPYSGNRLSIPSSVRSSHFFYKAVSLTGSAASLERLGSIAIPVFRQRATADHIEVLDRETLIRECGRSAALAWDRVTAALPAFTRQASEEFELVGCEWAGLHVDPGFAGLAFYSVVVRTGESDQRF